MAVITESILVYRGEVAQLNFAMTPGVNVTGWTIMFTVSKKVNSVAKLIGPLAAVPVNPVAGTFYFQLTEDHTNLSPGVYVSDVWRTDEGFEQLLALQTFTISGDARVPPLDE
jgi:hypothetical protein